MGRTKSKIISKSNTIIPIETFKHCIGWNNYNIPRITNKGQILYSYRNRFILNKNDNYLDNAVKEGYMVKASYCDKYNIFTLTDKGFKYIEQKENISIVKNIDYHNTATKDRINKIEKEESKNLTKTKKKTTRKKKRKNSSNNKKEVKH